MDTKYLKGLRDVFQGNMVYNKGIKYQEKDVTVSITITDQGDYYEAYATAMSENISNSVEKLKELQNEIAVDNDEEKNIAKQSENEWAEVTFRVDPDYFENL